jgi:hypothetical protein
MLPTLILHARLLPTFSETQTGPSVFLKPPLCCCRFKYRSPMEQLQTFQNEHLKGKNKLEDPGLLPPKIWVRPPTLDHIRIKLLVMYGHIFPSISSVTRVKV